MKLTSLERRMAHAVLDTLFPPCHEVGLTEGIAQTNLDQYLDELGAQWPTQAFLALRGALAAILFSPWLWLGTPRTFLQLQRHEREVVLRRLMASRLYLVRGLVTFVKAAGGIHYGAQHSVRSALTHDDLHENTVFFSQPQTA